MAVPRSEPLGGIQVIRGLAAASVALLHIGAAAGALVGARGVNPIPVVRDIPWQAGVDVFFVISGFVMVHSSLVLFAQPDAPRRFLGRRVARVVPLYWLATALTMMVALATPNLVNDPIGSGWPVVVTSFLFIPWQREGVMQPLFRLGWTLNFEMMFYVLFAPFLLLSRRPAVLGVIASIAALAAVGRWARPTNVQLAFWTDPIITEFAAGAALGALRAEGLRLPRALRFALIVAGLAAMVGFGSNDPQRALYYGIPAVGFVAAAGLGPAWAGGGSRISTAALILGDASYALYLVHPFPARGMSEIWVKLGLGGWAGVVTFTVAALLVSCLLAIALHRVVERPVVRLARRAFAARPT